MILVFALFLLGSLSESASVSVDGAALEVETRGDSAWCWSVCLGKLSDYECCLRCSLGGGDTRRFGVVLVGVPGQAQRLRVLPAVQPWRWRHAAIRRGAGRCAWASSA